LTAFLAGNYGLAYLKRDEAAYSSLHKYASLIPAIGSMVAQKSCKRFTNIHHESVRPARAEMCGL